jgi:hypothetical protein
VTIARSENIHLKFLTLTTPNQHLYSTIFLVDDYMQAALLLAVQISRDLFTFHLHHSAFRLQGAPISVDSRSSLLKISIVATPF